VYSSEYTEVPKVFFTPRAVTSAGCFVDRRLKGTVDKNQSYSKGVTNATIIPKVIVASVPTMKSVPTVTTICLNNVLGSHCYKNALQQWSLFQCCNNDFNPIVVTVFQQLTWFPLLQQCVPTMAPCHAGCLVPRKNATDRRTGGPMRWSSLTLEREEHLKTDI
jgi:hypothetical protein